MTADFCFPLSATLPFGRIAFLRWTRTASPLARRLILCSAIGGKSLWSYLVLLRTVVRIIPLWIWRRQYPLLAFEVCSHAPIAPKKIEPAILNLRWKCQVGLCNQYRDQLPTLVRAGVDANCRNKIIFGLTAPDAKDMAAMAPELDAVDFMSLPRYHIYASFQQNGKNTGWVSGKL